jgi:hypothetical protein
MDENMATYTSVAKVHPSSARVLSIADVSDGDRIDFIEALGRPARKVQFYMTDAADEVGYTLNSLKKLRTGREHEIVLSQAERFFGTYNTEVVEVWSGAASFPSLTSTGATTLETADGISIHSIQIDSLTLSVGTTISIVVW